MGRLVALRGFRRLVFHPRQRFPDRLSVVRRLVGLDQCRRVYANAHGFQDSTQHLRALVFRPAHPDPDLHVAGLGRYAKPKNPFRACADHDGNGDLAPTGVDEGFQLIHSQEITGAMEDLVSMLALGLDGQQADFALHRLRGAFKQPGNPGHGDAGDSQLKDPAIQIGAVLPMARTGTGGAETRAAGPALVARDGFAVSNGAIAVFGVEACLGRAVMFAGGVRAVRAWRAHGESMRWMDRLGEGASEKLLLEERF